MTLSPDLPNAPATRASATPIILDGRAGPDAGSEQQSPLFDGLNPQQLEAVKYRGPALLIVAGAGSGKTSVLTRRVAGLIETREAWPSQILAITFTNKAAAEMRERVKALLGQASDGMWISTFHSSCVRILRREAESAGLSANFSIYDSADSKVTIKRIIKQLDADTLGFTPGNVASKISKLKNELADVDSYARNANMSDPQEVMFVEIFRQYTRRLRAASALDFDDLIGETVFLFRAFPKVAALYRRRFRHILVDEYQDTNHAQYALVRELTRPVDAELADDMEDAGLHVKNLQDASGQIPGASLTVVGDSDQSIYAFRGASSRNITEFERDFPGTKVILLEQNYRSTQNILSAANAVIGNNFDRREKRLWSAGGDGEKIVGYTAYNGHDEAQFVADEIEVLHRAGMAYRDMAVFYRTNAQTRALEEILVRAAVPYRVVGGTKFYERAEIKDALAYLVAVANPLDELALRRILNTPKRGIGPATETQLASFAETNGISFRQAMRDSGGLGLGPKVTGAILQLATLLDSAALMMDPENPAGAANVSDLLTFLLDGSGLLAVLRASRDAQDEVRAENIEELVAQTKDFNRENPDAGLVDFLTQVSLVAAADDLDDASGTVSLMTLHTAKGLEYEAVFLTGVEEGLLPHQMSAGEPGGPAEERRLFYVGITRARQRLYLSLAMTRAQFGEVNVAMPSRYLQEIPATLIDWKQSPGMANSRGGTQPRALNARRDGGGFGSRSGTPGQLPPAPKPKTEWANRVTAQVRDNGDLSLNAGDRIRHVDFGDGKVNQVTGEGTKRIAHVQFDTSGAKKLLIKIAPIEKIE
ncbi:MULTISPECIES: ATP-dependent helicase [Cryobacterium]|uniref:ATP-dependent helicase n=1 Tax=Cryobacterium TaxID=69578 RepID=UPI000B4D1A10|nr:MULTISPECIES: UvrD-helicase domain-containing protein [Cryobacterium]ASD23071.1 ATP-dependent DNA helicase PcrA [Cryobacterium sp. LW097]MEC5184546.1 DNA helicase-2/ATP-dependent DNA helicase PcrA [Cryobacterium sp. MP_3.1]POH68572.1 ATP-dependent DNA helicase PcrA [Cryobacterium zongtaii]TFC42261.1 ATP-dependent DNA helicase PcrA [Cryobacterium sp. TMN-39-2]TFC53920.1 ATP-dependent DNA helicase PcrA [Cryobacterium sp. TMB3-1-2]